MQSKSGKLSLRLCIYFKSIINQSLVTDSTGLGWTGQNLEADDKFGTYCDRIHNANNESAQGNEDGDGNICGPPISVMDLPEVRRKNQGLRLG